MDKVVEIIAKSIRDGDIVDIKSFLKDLYNLTEDFDEVMRILKTTIVKSKLLSNIILEKERKFYFEIISLRMFPECVSELYKVRKDYLDAKFEEDFIEHLIENVK